MKKILALLSLILMLSEVFSLEISDKYCVNNTLVIERWGYWTVNNKTYNITKTEMILCEYGCEEKGEDAYCLPPPEKGMFFNLGLLGVILFILGILYWWFK